MNDIAKEYQDIYKQMRSKFRWQASDQRILMMAASFYIVKGSPFVLKDYSDLADYIKNKSPLFSPMRSHQRFTTAAMLIQRFDHPHEKFETLTHLYDKLVRGGFKKGTFTYISALVMMSDDNKERSHQALIQRSLEVHKGMKEHHPFLTSKNDYPLSVLLAQLDEEIEPIMDQVEHFYRQLDQNGFRKGNDLQFLSHILTMDKGSSADSLITRCLELSDQCRRRKIKIKPMHYPEIGLLAITHATAKDLDQVEAIQGELNQAKWFKWQKDMNTIMAVNFVIREKMDNQMLEAGIYTTMETIIQAQQAAMVAAMAGGVAVTANSSN